MGYVLNIPSGKLKNGMVERIEQLEIPPAHVIPEVSYDSGWIALGIPFYMFGQAMNPIIRSDGSPRFAMATLVIGAVLNIIFDPVCIFILNWGMAGKYLSWVRPAFCLRYLLYYLWQLRSM